MFFLTAKNLNDEGIVQAVEALRTGNSREKSNAFLDMRDTFSGLIFKSLGSVSKAFSGPQEKKDTQAFIEAEFFEILRGLKKDSNPAMIKSYIKSQLGRRINITRVNDFLGKTSIMKDIRAIEIELGKGLKKYYVKTKKLPNFKNPNDIKTLARIMKKPVNKVDEMISVYGPDKIKSIYSPAESSKSEENAKVLLDSINSQKPLPDKIYRDKELLKIFIKDMNRVLTPDERAVIKAVYHPENPRAPKKRLEDVAKDLEREDPSWNYRRVKHELSTAKRKLKKLPLAEEIKYARMKEQFVKYALVTYDYEIKNSFINCEKIISKVVNGR